MALLNTQLTASSLPVGSKQRVVLGNVTLGLFKLSTGLFAIDDLCPHRDAPLHTGWLDDDAVICPWHQWRFRLSDGACTNIPGGPKVKIYRVEVIEDVIWVEMKAGPAI